MSRLPELQDARQLHRLRSLRVQRARARIAEAEAAVGKAAATLQDRQRLVDEGRRRLDALAHAVAYGLGAQLPRWSQTALAQRDRLADRLERDEYALIGDQRELEETQEALQRARAELTRALAREDAVAGLVGDVRRALGALREQRLEREQEDQPLRPAVRA